jgi:hypothetical protein
MSIEYLIPIRDDLIGQYFHFSGLPEFNVKYVSYVNTLYNPSGTLEVTLLVNGKSINVDNHGHINKVDSYIIQGVDYVINDETYLKIKIFKDLPKTLF